MDDIRRKICATTVFFCIMAHMILGFCIQHYLNSMDGYWYGFLFYILVPLMPFLVGLKKIHITFEIAIALLYVIICLAVQYSTNGALKLWHPLWIMFLLIPVYHIFTPKNKGIKTTYTVNDDDKK